MSSSALHRKGIRVTVSECRMKYLEFLLLNIWTTLDCLYNCIELNCLETCRILDGNVEITVHTTEHCSQFNNTVPASLSLCIIHFLQGPPSLFSSSLEI